MIDERGLTTKTARSLPTLPDDVMALGRVLAQSGYFQDARDAGQAVVKVLAGQELGFGPIASMTGIYIVKGRVTLSANLMGAAIKRTGRYDFQVLTLTDQECRISFLQDGKAVGESQFALADAKRAGLEQGDNWKRYPRNMLYARALTNGAKWFCPDVLLGQPFPITTGGPGEEPEDDAPIIEGHPVDITTGEVRVVTEPPEGNKPNWNGFWADAHAMRLNRATVHQTFGVEDKGGALLDYARERSRQESKPLPQVVTEMREVLRQWDPEGFGAEGSGTTKSDDDTSAIPSLFDPDPTWDAPPPDFSDPRGDPRRVTPEDLR